MKPIAVAILNWNGASLLPTYLPTLLATTPQELADVVVIDNGSTDASLQYLQSLPQVKLITLEKNYGFAQGYNRGIAQLKHKYVVLLNSDVRTTEGWLQPLYKLLEEQPSVVAVQPKILWERHPSYFEYAGAQGGYLDYLGYPFCRGRIFGTLEEDKGQYGTQAEPVFWTTGAAMMVRRTAYQEADGLDQRYFAHQEEIDLAWRWQCKGWKLMVEPKSCVYHYGGASLSATHPHKTFLNFRNNLRMLYKLLPTRYLFTTLFVRFWLDLLAAFVFLLQKKPHDALAILRAGWAFLSEKKDRPKDIDRHRGYQRLYHHSLLIRYHLRGEKTFSQLKK